jgi:sigma-B regulation protein RsbU (phosphoserine phosphatase)
MPVLVVDDIAENRDILVRRLQRFGLIGIEQAANGLQALEAIGRRNFDLVLLDIMMPEMNGFEVLKKLWESGKITDMPVIVISALSELESVVRCIELGAEDFILKPFNATLLRARVMATLEKKKMRDEMRQELMRKRMELTEARTLQLALTPPPYRGSLHGRSLAVDVLLEPAKEVGGDLVDYFLVDENLLVLVLGDVSDKGAGAALVMARTHALIRGFAARPDAEELFLAPDRAATLLNATLAAANATGMFVTLFLGTFDARTGRFVYVRAGHVPPFLRRASGVIERLLGTSGLPIGVLEGATYSPTTIELCSGDCLLALTDGITEAMNPEKKLFGTAGVEACVQAFSSEEANPLMCLMEAVRRFEAGEPASDDVAVILMRHLTLASE